MSYGITFPSGHFVRLEVLLDSSVALPAIADSLGLELDEMLELVEAWAAGPGFTYGVRVDREAGTIRQAGR